MKEINEYVNKKIFNLTQLKLTAVTDYNPKSFEELQQLQQHNETLQQRAWSISQH